MAELPYLQSLKRAVRIRNSGPGRQEKKEEEKEAKAKKLKEQQEDRVKRSVVRGDSASELVKNIQAIDWDKGAEEVRPRAGGKIDFGV